MSGATCNSKVICAYLVKFYIRAFTSEFIIPKQMFLNVMKLAISFKKKNSARRGFLDFR
jgi:hypothetical protein